MDTFSFSEHPHRRYNPLTGEWVLVSPHRTKRPWQGKQEDADFTQLPQHDASCYLCPGNTRANGETNSDYKATYVFTNDFAAIRPEVIAHESNDDLFIAEPESGICRVICFSPRHDLSISRMTRAQVRGVVDLWRTEHADLAAREDIGYVQIFENRGSIMGCSNPHPHGQIWATRSVPYIPAAENEHQNAYLKDKGACLLCTYLERELASGERIIFENASFVALTPFWAVWPFEVMLLPKAHMGSIQQMDSSQCDDLADALIRMGVRYDNLFSTSFPYSMGIHQQPAQPSPYHSGEDANSQAWHWHIHYYPPLLRSATVKKFMVGFEMMAMPQRDITAEASAKRLRELSETHYTKTHHSDHA